MGKHMRGCLQNTKLLLVLAMFTGSLLLAACGQKGPLYLPDKKPRATEATEESAAPSGSQSEAKEETAAPLESQSEAVEDNTSKQGKSGEIPK